MDARIAQKTAKKNLDMQKKGTKKRHAVGWRYRREGVFKHRRRKTPQNAVNVKTYSRAIYKRVETLRLLPL